MRICTIFDNLLMLIFLMFRDVGTTVDLELIYFYEKYKLVNIALIINIETRATF